MEKTILSTPINGFIKIKKLKIKIRIPEISGNHHIDIFIFLNRKALLILDTATNIIQNPANKIKASPEI